MFYLYVQHICAYWNRQHTNSMTTDTFILALKRLISQRGNVRIIRTDNGTNFAGANIELRKAFYQTNHTTINNFLMKLGGKWVTWRQNPHMGSSMGEYWEGQICSTRNILNLLLITHGESLDNESLWALLLEVERIFNSRPRTCEFIGDVNSYVSLSAMQLLTMKTKLVMPPPGIFKEFFRRKIYIVKNNGVVSNICVMSFGQEG